MGTTNKSEPNRIAAFRDVTNNGSLHLNHAAKKCPACKKRRSMGQFQIYNAEVCDPCFRKGAGKA